MMRCHPVHVLTGSNGTYMYLANTSFAIFTLQFGWTQNRSHPKYPESPYSVHVPQHGSTPPHFITNLMLIPPLLGISMGSSDNLIPVAGGCARYCIGGMTCIPWLGILSMHKTPLPSSTAVASTASCIHTCTSWVVEVLPVSGGVGVTFTIGTGHF